MNFNQHQGFGLPVVWTIITVIAMVVIGWRKYYLHKTRSGAIVLVDDVRLSEIRRYSIIFSAFLAVFLLVLSWKPILEPMMGLPEIVAVFFGLVAVASLTVLQNIVLRIVVVATMLFRHDLLDRRRTAYYRNRRRRNFVIQLLERGEESWPGL